MFRLLSIQVKAIWLGIRMLFMLKRVPEILSCWEPEVYILELVVSEHGSGIPRGYFIDGVSSLE